MKNLADSSLNNASNSESHLGAEIPDPAEWVYEHHCLASFAHALTYLQHLLPDGSFLSGDNSDPEEGELVINRRARDILRANYSEDRWQYVENYLLVWDS